LNIINYTFSFSVKFVMKMFWLNYLILIALK
jgi:hypothetical protein